MKAFADLIRALDATNKTNAKVAALEAYFRKAPERDKVWAIALLSHRRPPRPVQTPLLRAWAAELAGIPMWLFEESYHIVGDLAETIALVIPHQPEAAPESRSLADHLEDLIALKLAAPDAQKAYLTRHWAQLDYYERFVLTKFMTGGFRIGISQKLMTRALAQATGIAEDLLAYRLMGNWDPARTTFRRLVLEEQELETASRPYPFCLAYGLEARPEDLGDPTDWLMEYKWDGIRAQLVIRGGGHFLWSRGEELVTDSYPEMAALATALPDGTVLDGELLPFTGGQVGSFNTLQKRLGRKTVSKAMLKQVPVVLRAYDLLEWEGQDIRLRPFRERRRLLEGLLTPLSGRADLPIDLSPAFEIETWQAARQARETSREARSEGLMLKRRSAAYGVGRKKGDWWKWKVDPLTVDAVLTYAMRGHGRRSNLFTDYTFALWDREAGENRTELVTFAKAYSGLTDAELREVDRWIRSHTIERFGPVRAVEPRLVFEIAFEGIARSSRHKSGIATRFPRILRWRRDKPAGEADSLQTLEKMLPQE